MKLGLALTACASIALASCSNTTLDERLAIGVETAYAAAANAAALAFRSGVIAPSQDPAVRQADFCTRVAAKSVTPTDKGGRVAALDCKVHDALVRMRAAQTAGNAAQYAAAFTEAQAGLREINDIIKGAR